MTFPSNSGCSHFLDIIRHTKVIKIEVGKTAEVYMLLLREHATLREERFVHVFPDSALPLGLGVMRLTDVEPHNIDRKFVQHSAILIK